MTIFQNTKSESFERKPSVFLTRNSIHVRREYTVKAWGFSSQKIRAHSTLKHIIFLSHSRKHDLTFVPF